MAPKRFKKSNVNAENGEKYKNLVISDVLCPICRSILVEPVTLPCNHGFCLACFNGTMENNTLTCPLCRTRVGSWLRSAKKEKKIINAALWQIIQLKFSKEIRKKLDGDDVTPDEKVNILLANPGEIRREFELQLERERSEIQKQHDCEAKASEIVIKKLLEEEQQAVKVEEEKLRLDEEIARRLTAEQENEGPSCSTQVTPKSIPKKSSIDRYLIALSKKKQESEPTSKSSEREVSASSTKVKKSEPSSNINTALSSQSRTSSTKNYSSTIMCQSRVKQQCSKAYQHLLLTKTLQCERADSNGSDSGDSIKQEMRYFKPIRLAPAVDKYQDGNIVRVPVLKLPSVLATSNSSAVIRSPQSNMISRIGANPRSAFVSCSPNPIPTCVSPVKQPSVMIENGKVIKQYYNKKRNTQFGNVQTSTIVSPSSSPFLGFEPKIQLNHIDILNDKIKSLSEHVNGILVHASDVENNSKEFIKQKLTCSDSSHMKENISYKKSPKKLNGCNAADILDSSVSFVPKDTNVQEQLDLEFAKRLHEELNNPRSRQTRISAQSKKPTVKTRSSPRKRQVTLDELIPSKKFKI